MNTQLKSANVSFAEFHGSEQLFINPSTKLNYTEGVRAVTQSTESYWFLDLIASYQPKLKDEYFQVWKLEREYSFSIVDGVKFVGQRKDCFNVVCDDGNNEILIKQHISFSDFKYDEYTVWCVDGVVLLASEY